MSLTSDRYLAVTGSPLRRSVVPSPPLLVTEISGLEDATLSQLTKTEGGHTEPDAGEPKHTSRRRLLGWAALIAVVALVLGFAALQLSRTGRSPSRLASAYGFTIGDSPVGAERLSRPAPRLRGEALDGGFLDLSSYRGNIVVINLWASWCGPCRAEQPELQRLWNQYRDRGVQFLGLNVRDTRAAAKAFREEFHVSYPSFFDPSAALTYRLGVEVLPTTFIINPDGRIVVRFSGRVDGRLLDRTVEDLLGKARP